MSLLPARQAADAFDAVTAPDGTRIAAFREGGEGLPVLFSNSLGADWRMWDGVCARLGDIARIRYDSRGHGRSDAPRGPYTPQLVAHDALAVLDHYGIERALVCGLSLGGVVGMWLGANVPDRVAGLVLANTAVSFPPASMWEQRAASARGEGIAGLVEPSLERWFTAPYRDAGSETMEDMRDMIAGTSPEGYAASCELLASVDLVPSLGSIACPVLAIAGAGDPSTPPTRAREIADAIPGARVQSLEAAHMSAVEQPEAFARALVAFHDTLRE